ncbi:CB1 cannabinoid receptor-interacting protein 1 [Cotesia typhae]|uniref:CB1 cannabinoid receptor-interacting protein 1 n=1 Tax=Cotesia typhae TaxID=2053667 RepID=UPI003D69F987
MGASDNYFRVTISLKKEPNTGPVYCKMEKSNKYRQQKTVKLFCDAMYRFDVSFKPPQQLELFSIDGELIEVTEQLRDGTACAYSAYYSTNNADPSPRGQRKELPMTIRVFGSEDLKSSLQIKYYRSDDHKHCEYGSKLHCIELDCSSLDGNLATVDKETYRKIGVDP